MNKTLLLTLCTSLIASPASADQLTFAIEGEFTDKGPLAHGRFEGSFSYDAETPDTNPHVLNVGVFQVSDLDITVYDAQSVVVDELNDENTVGKVVLTVPLSGTNRYRLLAHPNNTVLNGQIGLEFNFPGDAKPDVVPQTAPSQFTDGKYILPMPFQQQAIASATITTPDATVVTNEKLPFVGRVLAGGIVSILAVTSTFLGVGRKHV